MRLDWGVFLAALTMACGCARSPQLQACVPRVPGLVRISILRQDPATQALHSLQPGELLQAGESPTLELTVDAPAQVAVVLHSFQGESEELASDGSQSPLMTPGVPRRFTIPRRAPPGVSETELRLYVVISRESLGGAARALLRLPCGAALDSGRGDRDDTKKEPEKKAPEKKDDGKSDSRSGKPDEGDRKGPGEARRCASPAGLFAPFSITPLVIASQ